VSSTRLYWDLSWRRREYGGLTLYQAKPLKDLGKERLTRAVSDLTLDKLNLRFNRNGIIDRG
jgi:hypothetical protein